jgi:hypothetical protein
MWVGSSQRVVERRSVVVGHAPDLDEGAPALHAVKIATPVVWGADAHLQFIPKVMATAGSYAPVEVARCTRGHAAPEPDCHCGFHAAHDVRLLARMVPRPGAGAAVLNVELGGTCVEGSRGVRAAEQRVLRVSLADSCFACSSPAEGVAVGKGDIGARPLITACSRHIAGYDAVALGDSAKRFADVEVGLLPPGCAGWLPQGWLRPYDLAGVKKFDRRVTSLLRRQMVRTAAGIPVGQSVYVEASGVVLDSDGVGIIDGRASVSRKPTGIHTILVRRQTPERFELCSPLAAGPSRWRVGFLANADPASDRGDARDRCSPTRSSRSPG